METNTFDVEFRDGSGTFVKAFKNVEKQRALDLVRQAGIPVRYRRTALVWNQTERRPLIIVAARGDIR